MKNIYYEKDFNDEIFSTEKTFEYEKSKGSKYVNGVIARTLGISSNSDLIISKIKSEIVPGETIIITGIGKCYGIVRGHTILNNLHSIVTNNPLVMLYPGMYDGQSFKLFNKFIISYNE